ncbi:MAG: pyridine nucleotide-disulfide oxidoreductase, partial [Gammaproteobacteria bacterium]|nr:pyridine nucleotide-disulfide oxidoreductase [Gammaproteobacteria bacterium]
MNKYEWAIVGAGPAGMAALGKLIDLGVPAKKIAWIDPEFKVGDFGTRWLNVSSNTKVDLFIKFLNGYKAFNYSECKEVFALHQQDPEATCQLKYAADPLQWVTEQLKSQVNSI